jgi:hypothetical protein
MPQAVCPVCGEPFTPAPCGGPYPQKYCSPACRSRRTRTCADTITLDCGHCGTAMVKKATELKRYPTSYCSKACAASAHWEQKRQARLAIVGPVRRTIIVAGPTCPTPMEPARSIWCDYRCVECDERFITDTKYTNFYCSGQCAKRAGRRQRKYRARNATKTARVLRRRVFERDDWTCRICLKPVLRGTAPSHPKAATIDHILPLALGGEHTYANVQTAHHGCNSSKGARVSQLSLGW